jgi:hypothetical protein
MDREQLLGPRPEGESEPDPFVPDEGSGYKGVTFGAGLILLLALKAAHSFGLFDRVRPEPRLDVAAEIQAGVSQIRAQLPMRVDEITRMTEVSGSGNRLIYTYAVSEDLTPEELAAARAELPALRQRELCVDQGARRLIEAGAVFVYHYVDTARDAIDAEVRSCPAASSASTRPPNS